MHTQAGVNCEHCKLAYEASLCRFDASDPFPLNYTDTSTVNCHVTPKASTVGFAGLSFSNNGGSDWQEGGALHSHIYLLLARASIYSRATRLNSFVHLLQKPPSRLSSLVCFVKPPSPPPFELPPYSTCCVNHLIRALNHSQSSAARGGIPTNNRVSSNET